MHDLRYNLIYINSFPSHLVCVDMRFRCIGTLIGIEVYVAIRDGAPDLKGDFCQMMCLFISN